MDTCKHLKKFNEIQKDIILKHIANHKWFRHIEDEQTAIADFIDNFGWLMRDMYCLSLCKNKETCTIIKNNTTKIK